MTDSAEIDRWSTELGKRVGRAIAAARSTAGMSRDTLAQQVGLSRNGIVNLELGRAANLRVPVVLMIAAALGVPPASLLFPDVTTDVEVLPGKSMRGLSAFGWFIGAGGPVGLVHDRAYVPEGIKSDGSMRIPLQLLQIEQQIVEYEHSLVQSEGGQAHAANDAVRDMLRQQSEATRKTIEALNLEHGRLLGECRERLRDA